LRHSTISLCLILTKELPFNICKFIIESFFLEEFWNCYLFIIYPIAYSLSISNWYYFKIFILLFWMVSKYLHFFSAQLVLENYWNSSQAFHFISKIIFFYYKMTEMISMFLLLLILVWFLFKMKPLIILSKKWENNNNLYLYRHFRRNN
jgi:hypothetical protein